MYEPAEYPDTARGAGASGTVTLAVTIDELGRVVEVRRAAFTEGPKANETPLADAFTAAADRAVRQWRYEPPAKGPLTFLVSFRFNPDGETSALHHAGARATGAHGAEPRPAWAADAVRVGSGIRPPRKIKHVNPAYPVEAMQARVTGVVVIEALIGSDGAVHHAHVLRSIPLLDQAAVDAVMQWRFTPTILNGQAVPIVMTVTVNFTVRSPDGDK